ncbi:MAG: glycine dehydrogenase (aminomethyl-transferring), partial [Verrucomicrobiales bacterium]
MVCLTPPLTASRWVEIPSSIAQLMKKAKTPKQDSASAGKVAPGNTDPAEADFARRHLGSRPAQIGEMARLLGHDSAAQLVDAVVPEAIRRRASLELPAALSEREAIDKLRDIMGRNRVARSFIGTGYYGCFTPAVIQRNVLENPGWYTAYTSYQAEISQGRLEALLAFQTMVADLTGLKIANASLLDEGSAAAEAMAMCASASIVPGRKRFFISSHCHPQTIEVVQGRADPRGIEILTGDVSAVDFADSEGFFGVLLQYPATTGEIVDYTDFCARAEAAGVTVVVATDLLALTLLRPPGEFGAAIAIGSAQRFGVPLGYGGPHAAFIAVAERVKRRLPGRLVGVSR